MKATLRTYTFLNYMALVWMTDIWGGFVLIVVVVAFVVILLLRINKAFFLIENQTDGELGLDPRILLVCSFLHLILIK